MEKNDKFLKFPEGFLWGTATAAHQIEGNNKNDWSEWERSEARMQKLEARSLKAEDFISGLACDSYNLWEKDLDLVKELNCNAYRFSLEWSRIEPEEGQWNMSEMEHYKKILISMKERGIKPFVALWHWTNPVWVARHGGWADKKVVDYFSRFTEKVVVELGDYVDFWVTLNEPLMHIAHGYWTGKFPPGKKLDLIGSFKVFNNLAEAHKASYGIIHKKFPGAQVSVAMTNGYFSAAHKNNIIEKSIVKACNFLRNEWFIKKISGSYDYLGINYYHHDRIVWYPPFKKNLNEKISDFGWEIYPEGIYHVLKNYQKHEKPLYVLENGIADREDKYRKGFILDHLKYVHKAITEGADVRGYFYWSLLDNFEWAEGYTMKFGLYAVDRDTCHRTKRPSADAYGEICKNNGF